MDGEISTDEVRRLLEAEADVCVVDIRDERSFERGHIPGSVNLPFHELAGRIDELEAEDRIVTVCPHGQASVQAARLVGSYEGTGDARVESMAGGIEEFAEKYDLAAGEDGTADGEATDDGATSDASTDDAPF